MMTEPSFSSNLSSHEHQLNSTLTLLIKEMVIHLQCKLQQTQLELIMQLGQARFLMFYDAAISHTALMIYSTYLLHWDKRIMSTLQQSHCNTQALL